MSPMFFAWSSARSLTLVPGTLNLCADRPVRVPEEFESLQDYGVHAPPGRRQQPGFHPRVYRVVLNDNVPAWLFRWSAPESLRVFVGFANDCPPEHRCEIIASSHLRSELELKDGDVVTLSFEERLGGTYMS
jgi:CTP-dependent riboflavin kinase